MRKRKDHLRGLLYLPACGQRERKSKPLTSDFIDFGDSIRLGFACTKCTELWHVEQAVRTHFFANREALIEAAMNEGIINSPKS